MANKLLYIIISYKINELGLKDVQSEEYTQSKNTSVCFPNHMGQLRMNILLALLLQNILQWLLVILISNFYVAENF